MALTFEMIESRVTSGGAQSVSPNSVASTMQWTFKLHAKDDGKVPAWNGVPSSIDEADVGEWMAQNVIGYINSNLLVRWKWSVDAGKYTWMVLPWHFLTQRTVVRNVNNSLMFDCAMTFSVPRTFTIKEDQFKWIEVPATIGAYPYLDEVLFDETSRILWNELEVTPEARLCLPTGNQFAQPFMTREAQRLVRQRQYEGVSASNIETTIEQRLFTLCDRNYRADPPDPKRWWCTQVQYQVVRLPTFNGVDLSYDDGYLMTYTLARSNKPKGWQDERALIDTHYLETADDRDSRVLFKNKEGNQSIVSGLIKEDGTAADDQNGVAETKGYNVQPTGVWDWLKGTSGP